MDKEYEEETKDSSPWNDDDDTLTREHVNGGPALNEQINLKSMLIYSS